MFLKPTLRGRFVSQAAVSSDEDILAAINVDNFPDGQQVNLEAIFGNSLTYDADGAVSGARAMMQVGCDRPRWGAPLES